MPYYHKANLQYTPITFEEMIRPLAAYKETYENYRDTAESYLDKIAELKALAQEDDDVAQKMILDAQNGYNDAMNAINSNGLSLNDNAAFMNARKGYRDKMLPLAQAIQEDMKRKAAYREKYETGDLRFQQGKNPMQMKASDYLYGNLPDVAFLTGAEVKNEAYKQLSAAMEADYSRTGNTYSTQKKGLYNLDSKVDAFFKLMNDAAIATDPETKAQLLEQARKIGNDYMQGNYKDSNADGPLWRIFNDVMNNNNINDATYSPEDINYFKDKIYEGMKNVQNGVDHSTYTPAANLYNDYPNGVYDDNGNLANLYIKGLWEKHSGDVQMTKYDDVKNIGIVSRTDSNGVKQLIPGLIVMKPNPTGITTTGFYSSPPQYHKVGLGLDNFIQSNGQLKSDKEIEAYLKRNGVVEGKNYIRSIKQLYDNVTTEMTRLGRSVSKDNFMNFASNIVGGKGTSFETDEIFGASSRVFSSTNISNQNLTKLNKGNDILYDPNQKTTIIINYGRGKIYLEQTIITNNDTKAKKENYYRGEITNPETVLGKEAYQALMRIPRYSDILNELKLNGENSTMKEARYLIKTYGNVNAAINNMIHNIAMDKKIVETQLEPKVQNAINTTPTHTEYEQENQTSVY